MLKRRLNRQGKRSGCLLVRSAEALLAANTAKGFGAAVQFG